MPVSICAGMAAARRPNGRGVPAPGEELCVAFANTRSWRGSEAAVETLSGLNAVLGWCERANTIDARARAELDAWASRHHGDATRLFGDAIAARELIYGVFSAQADGKPPAERDIEALNRLLADTPSRASLLAGAEGTMW